VLILSLRVNESILLPGDVEIMLTSIGVRGLRLRGGHVKLGIVAPKHVRVHRGRKLVKRTKS
jgi:carbon storage regulator CsrA